jgi:hypothetical protein
MLPARSQAYLDRNPNVNLRRHEVLTVLVDWTKKHGGITPCERELWRYFKLHAGDFGFNPMGYSTLRRHLDTLIKKDKVVDKKDGVIFFPGQPAWRPPKGLPLVNRRPQQLCLPLN